MKVAVIGGGVSGLGAAHALGAAHPVELFEASETLGGHVRTVRVGATRGGSGAAVDMGFIVFNEARYPRFAALLRQLGVATRGTEMSFGVECARERIAYATSGLGGLFAQRSDVLRASHHRLLAGIVRFTRIARRAHRSEIPVDVTLGEFLDRARVGTAVAKYFVLPLGAALWSCAPGQMLDFPAVTFLRFCANHGMLDLVGAPQWRTIVGGSDAYVRALESRLVATVRRGSPVARVHRQRDGVTIELESGATHAFDAAIIATHAPRALAMLVEPTANERRVLGAIRYAPNVAWLHTDDSVLPREHRARASWNVRLDGANVRGFPSVTYWMNRLQGLAPGVNYCVTLNPEHPIASEHVVARADFEHPVFDRAAIEAQREFDRIDGACRSWFCGAYRGFGFHEDGLRSGIAAAHRLLAHASASRENEEAP